MKKTDSLPFFVILQWITLNEKENSEMVTPEEDPPAITLNQY